MGIVHRDAVIYCNWERSACWVYRVQESTDCGIGQTCSDEAPSQRVWWLRECWVVCCNLGIHTHTITQGNWIQKGIDMAKGRKKGYNTKVRAWVSIVAMSCRESPSTGLVASDYLRTDNHHQFFFLPPFGYPSRACTPTFIQRDPISLALPAIHPKCASPNFDDLLLSGASNDEKCAHFTGVHRNANDCFSKRHTKIMRVRRRGISSTHPPRFWPSPHTERRIQRQRRRRGSLFCATRLKQKL